MNTNAPLTEVELPSGPQAGSRLTLYPNRIAYTAPDAMQMVPLAQLAAVGVAFERDVRKLNWAIALLVLALLLAAVSAPLRDWMLSLATRMGEPGRRESLDAVLVSVFGALATAARLLALAAALLAGLAAWLIALFWMGVTTLTLTFGALERDFPVRGRSLQLIDFAHAIGEQLAARKV